MEGGRAVAHRYRMAGSHKLGKRLLELPNFGASGQPIGAQYLGYGRDVLFIYMLAAVGQNRPSHRCAAVQG